MLKDLFGPSRSLFSTRYACMKLLKDPKDDFATYAGRVNRECAKFKQSECNENQLKCLMFVCGLQSSDDAFIRLKLLNRIEADPKVRTLTEEVKQLVNVLPKVAMLVHCEQISLSHSQRDLHGIVELRMAITTV
ncbi:unnamed protein product [Nippostrongylus brasiliensis]|uniref:Retrotrans_gag domain-containing protein n=1 Tax=Nippostrongylus brasiliensis TaxID=27835 RepID=A0A0N4YA08_NIPBR|nr:unnamed protein product [Nippostrongylus brasiliensis]